jgi:hypothetical protein
MRLAVHKAARRACIVVVLVMTVQSQRLKSSRRADRAGGTARRNIATQRFSRLSLQSRSRWAFANQRAGSRMRRRGFIAVPTADALGPQIISEGRPRRGTLRLSEVFSTSFNAFGRHVVAFVILSAIAHIPLLLLYLWPFMMVRCAPRALFLFLLLAEFATTIKSSGGFDPQPPPRRANVRAVGCSATDLTNASRTFSGLTASSRDIATDVLAGALLPNYCGCWPCGPLRPYVGHFSANSLG